MTIFYRGYRFKCICGRDVQGAYPLPPGQAAQQIKTGQLAPVDRDRAICSDSVNAPAGQRFAGTLRGRIVGCGRTLKQVDEEIARRSREGIPIWASLRNARAPAAAAT